MSEENPRRRGESPAAYSRRLRDERVFAALEEEDRKERAQRAQQESCAHYNCEPTEWHWDGTPREMHCRDCGLTNYIEGKENV